MPTPLLYVDTSVIGGVFDREFSRPSSLFWEQVQRGICRILISALVVREVSRAPSPVRTYFDDVIGPLADVVEVTIDMRELATAYIEAQVLPESARDDALHVAAATLAGARSVVSWNYRHLVNIRREDAFNSVNLLNSYPLIRIISPLEVIGDVE